MTYYATSGGSHYHRDQTCHGLNAYYAEANYWDTAPVVKLREIRKRELLPCKLCKPSVIPALSLLAGGRED